MFRQIASNHIHHGNGCPECAVANKTRIIIKPGQRFGELRATGVTATTVAGKRRKRVRTEQVVCPHGVIKFIRLVDLRRGWTRSCRQWAECSSAAKANEVFGELKATGNHKRVGTNKTAEVICSHGNTQFVFLSKLRSGKTKGCSHWPKCSAAKVGEIFGRLVATGENRQGRRALAQVVCPHGVSKFVLLASLRRSVQHDKRLSLMARVQTYQRRSSPPCPHAKSDAKGGQACAGKIARRSLYRLWERSPQSKAGF